MSCVPPPPPPSITGPITRTDIVRYQGASGDMYRVHHDDDYARTLGFPSVFSVGMYQGGLLAAWAARWLGAENLRLLRLRFLEPVWPGDVLICSGEILLNQELGNENQVEVELQCKRQTGGVAVKAWATFVLNCGAYDD